MASVISRNDKFCVVYSYFDKDGKRRQKWETFKTLGEANKNDRQYCMLSALRQTKICPATTSTCKKI